MAKTKPQTEQKTTLKSWEEVDGLLKSIAVIESKKMQEESAMNEQTLKIQQFYQPTLNKLNAEKIGYERDIQLFCDAKKSEFSESRSKALNYGLIGFRRGKGALKTLKGFTWESVKTLLDSSKKYAEFLKIKKDIDKNALLNAGMKADQLAKVGVQIVQEDTFYYEAYLKKSEAMPTERVSE